MATSDKLNYLIDAKQAIKTAIQSKGVDITDNDTFRSYADKISSIPQTAKTDDWRPEPDWWDIESILENDTEDYEQKMIILINDNDDLVQVQGFQKYKLSDGQVIEATVTDKKIFTFDANKDKNCSKGYKTRYILCYSNLINYTNIETPTNSLYIIIDKVKLNNSSKFLEQRNLLQSITIKALFAYSDNLKFTDDVSLTTIKGYENIVFNNVGTSIMSKFSNCCLLKEAPTLDFSNKENISSLFYGCTNLKSIKNLTLSENIKVVSNAFFNLEKVEELLIDFSSGTITSFNQCFGNCKNLKKIGRLNFENAIIQTNNSSIFQGCYSLEEIESIENVSISLNFNNSSHLRNSTLLKILNGLVDLTGQTAMTLTLGATNLAKLTDEEKAIATDKNWILK